MTATPSFVLSSLLVLGGAQACSSKKAAPSPTSAASAQTAPSAPAQAPATPSAPAQPFDPFASGYCETTVDGANPKKTPGGIANISSAHWAHANMRKPSWSLLMNCGNIDLSSSGDATSLPMKPGKVAIVSGDAANKPGVITSSTIGQSQGEMTIDAWDMSGIRGSFQFKGMRDGKTATFAGKFDFKCPYAPKPGMPCAN